MCDKYLGGALPGCLWGRGRGTTQNITSRLLPATIMNGTRCAVPLNRTLSAHGGNTDLTNCHVEVKEVS
jgi:hypothetical protein